MPAAGKAYALPNNQRAIAKRKNLILAVKPLMDALIRGRGQVILSGSVRQYFETFGKMIRL